MTPAPPPVEFDDAMVLSVIRAVLSDPMYGACGSTPPERMERTRVALTAANVVPRSVVDSDFVPRAELEKAEARVAELEAENAKLREDAERLDLIASEYLHVAPFDMPTGGGDADVGWVISQAQGKNLVETVRHYSDDLRAAIDAARSPSASARGGEGGSDA
jgi:hypothetical protein